MNMHMINHLVRNSPIILQNVVVLCTDCECDPLRYREELGEFSIWNVVQFYGMCFRDHELCPRLDLARWTRRYAPG